MKLPSIPFLADAFLAVLRRFPFVMLAAAVGTVALMCLLEDGTTQGEKAFLKLVMACSLGLALTLCAKLVAEKWRLSPALGLLPSVAAIGLCVLYYFSLDWSEFDNARTPIRFIGLNLAAHLGVAFIPYLGAASVEDFWEYNKRLFGNFVVGAFYSLIIFTGLSIAILAVNELFNLSIDSMVYGHLFVFIAGIFNTAFFLAHFPERYDFSAEVAETGQSVGSANPYTTSFKNLSKFILIPIVAIYFLILYAFSAKILVQWELPEGWVGKLVLGFSVAGILTYLLNYLLVKYDDSVVVASFRRWFFFVLLPMVVLLFVAIGRRLSDYGVTEPRYVVAIAGVWLLLLSLYFIISKKDNIKFIPISLAVVALVTVLGPFSAFRVSERNQTSRFMEVLLRNNMLKDGKAVPAADSLSRTDAERLRGSLDYLSQNGHFEAIAPLFGLPKDSVPDWQAKENLIASLGVTAAVGPSTYCYFSFKEVKQREMDIAGYELFYQVYAYGREKPSNDFTGFAISDGGTGLQHYVNGEKMDSFDLSPYSKRLFDNAPCNGQEAADSLANYQTSGTRSEIRFSAVNLTYENDGKQVLRDFSGQVVLRKKQ